MCNYDLIMITFIWDKNKNASNIKKHGVSFQEAADAFYDEDALLIDDPAHSEEEERFVLLGMSNYANLLVVCHCYRDSEETIRIISARKANKRETKQYYERKPV